jgi:prepilin-type N-terminal cleavage/methylation domain-containing protein
VHSHVRWHGGAFTLIELLVVISVIAILISITIPALGRARETSRRAKCLANLRSIGTGFQMYLNGAGKGIFPYVNPLHGTPSPTHPNDVSLLTLLSEYLDAEVPRREDPDSTASRNSLYIVSDPYRCPSDNGQRTSEQGDTGGEPTWRTTGCSYEYRAGLYMLLAESFFIPRPAFAVTKAYEKDRNWAIVMDWSNWHPRRGKDGDKNASFFPDYRADWYTEINTSDLTRFVADLRRYGG